MELPKLDHQSAYTCTKSIGTTDALVKFSSDIAINLDKQEPIASLCY